MGRINKFNGRKTTYTKPRVTQSTEMRPEECRHSADIRSLSVSLSHTHTQTDCAVNVCHNNHVSMKCTSFRRILHKDGLCPDTFLLHDCPALLKTSDHMSHYYYYYSFCHVSVLCLDFTWLCTLTLCKPPVSGKLNIPTLCKPPITAYLSTATLCKPPTSG